MTYLKKLTHFLKNLINNIGWQWNQLLWGILLGLRKWEFAAPILKVYCILVVKISKLNNYLIKF